MECADQVEETEGPSLLGASIKHSHQLRVSRGSLGDGGVGRKDNQLGLRAPSQLAARVWFNQP